MKYRIILEGEDLAEDVEGFVADIENSGVAGEEEGYVIIVERVELQVIPAVIP
jgi:hypothetical protein